MSANTTIEWADHTFNPWIGCTKMGEGCDGCYAEARMDKRLHIVQWGPHAERKRTSERNWRDPVKWNDNAAAFLEQHGRRQRVFCASLADVFDNQVPAEWRADLFALIQRTPNLDWLLLTKRVGNVQAMAMQANWPWPMPRNIWIGATLVNREEMLRDAPKLRALPAAVTFWSVEPMLGDFGHLPLDLLPSWVICGGESGPQARPMHPDWARSLRDQCAAAGVPFLFKQWGEWAEFNGDKPNRTVRVESDIGETLAARCDGFISRAGEFIHNMGEATTDDPYRGMQRVGKKKAGRLLDGIEHNGFPA